LKHGEGEIFEQHEKISFRIGEGDATPGLELALRHTKKGEKALCRCTTRFGYGPVGRLAANEKELAVPKDEDIGYEIEVINISPPYNAGDCSSDERIHEAELKKMHGNGFFVHGDYQRATRAYNNAIKCLDIQRIVSNRLINKWIFKIFCFFRIVIF